MPRCAISSSVAVTIARSALASLGLPIVLAGEESFVIFGCTSLTPTRWSYGTRRFRKTDHSILSIPASLVRSKRPTRPSKARRSTVLAGSFEGGRRPRYRDAHGARAGGGAPRRRPPHQR